MTCNQELLMRLAMGLDAMAQGDDRRAREEAARVLGHLAQHGATEQALLEQCQQEGAKVGK
jgi:hypothetical protein